MTGKQAGLVRLVRGQLVPVSKRSAYATYSARHRRVRLERGPARVYLCEGCCGSAAAEWAAVHDSPEFVPLCMKCHRAYDRIPHEAVVYNSSITI